MSQALHGENGFQNGIFHVENEAQNCTLHVGNGFQNGYQNGWKMNMHFQNEFAFPYNFEALRLQGWFYGVP